MAWRLSPSLAKLREEVNARWPGRDKSSDGTIGDRAHASRRSDHNPDGRGMVHAWDCDKDGPDMGLILREAISDHRTEYVIWNRKIYSRAYGFRERTYTGSNPHTGHMHISGRHGTTWEDDLRSWLDAPTPATPPAPGPYSPWGPRPYPGGNGYRMNNSTKHDGNVEWIQRALNNTNLRSKLVTDGRFGPATDRAVRGFQGAMGLKQDAVVGPVTWSKLNGWAR